MAKENDKGNNEPTPNFWWVYQGKTYTPAKGQQYLWAPHKDQHSRTHAHWSAIGRVRKGDIIFNYAKKALRGVSIARGPGYPFENKEPPWEREGTRVDIDHHGLSEIPFAQVKKRFGKLQSALKDVSNHPFDRNGDPRQGYLFDLNLKAVNVIRGVYGKPFPSPIETCIKGGRLGQNEINPEDLLIELLTKKKQVILYGPPGTGKTYNTKKIAVDLLGRE